MDDWNNFNFARNGCYINAIFFLNHLYYGLGCKDKENLSNYKIFPPFLMFSVAHNG
jgi:hypothetical protein